MKKKYIIVISILLFLSIITLCILLFFKKENFKKKSNQSIDLMLKSTFEKLNKIENFHKKIPKLQSIENFNDEIPDTPVDTPVDNANDKNIFGLEICPTDVNFEIMNCLSEGISDFISVSGNQLFRKLFLHKNEISWRDLAINVSLQTGITALTVTLTSLGLGFATPLVQIFSPYEKNDKLPIDHDKIYLSIEDNFIKDRIIICNTTIQNTISYINNVYLPAKLTSNTTCDIGITNETTFDCVKNNIDSNIVKPSYKVENKNKRVILKELLGIGSVPHDLFYNSNYGINFIKQYYKKNTSCAIQLFKAFITIMNLEIGYFQELSLIDTTFEPITKDYINPWKSTIIGDTKRIGKLQLSSSLIGRLQQYCQDLFDMLRFMLKNYYNNLYWRMNCNQKDYYAGPDDIIWTDKTWGSCAGRTVTYFMQDRNKVIEQPQWINDLEIKEKQVLLGNSDVVKFTKASENLKYIYINKFLFFLADPFKQLANLKKIAGIKWLRNEKYYYDINEENNLSNYFYDAASSYYEIQYNTPTEYTEDGGFPYGLDSDSYKNAITNMSQTIEQSYLLKTYPSPIIEFNMKNACSDLTAKIDATIFNGPFSDKKYSENMICDGDVYLSSLLPEKSPGNSKTDLPTNKSRIAYCLSLDNKTYPLSERSNNCNNPSAIIFYDISDVILRIATTYNATNIFKGIEYVLVIGAYLGKEENIKNTMQINSIGNKDYIIRDDFNSSIAKYHFTEDNFNLDLFISGDLIYNSIDGKINGKMPIDADFNVKQNFIMDKSRNIICKRNTTKKKPVGFPESYPLNL